jgi:hypothetical protein
MRFQFVGILMVLKVFMNKSLTIGRSSSIGCRVRRALVNMRGARLSRVRRSVILALLQ